MTAFWGTDWPRDIVVVAAGSDEQFRALAGGGADIAAATTAERIVFAPGAAAMSDAALRIVLRHELFHYAARADTAADAPRWLTEGVADFVARPHTAGGRSRPPRWRRCPPTPTSTAPARPDRWPTTGPGGSAGSSPTGTAPPRCGRCTCAPAAAGHPDAETAVRDTLGADLDEVLTAVAAMADRLA